MARQILHKVCLLSAHILLHLPPAPGPAVATAALLPGIREGQQPFVGLGGTE